MVKASERVLFREFWGSIVTNVRPPHLMCSILSRNLVWCRQRNIKMMGTRDDDDDEEDANVDASSAVCSATSAGYALSQLRLMATPSWNVQIVGKCFERLALEKDMDEDRSADFFLPAMVDAVVVSAVPAEILLLVREVLRSVYALGRQGYWSTTFYAAVEYILQMTPEFTSDSCEYEQAYDSDNNDEVTDCI